MNGYICSNCGLHYADRCPACGYGHRTPMGAISLIGVLDADIQIRRIDAGPRASLLIQQPSGPVWIDLKPEDLTASQF